MVLFELGCIVGAIAGGLAVAYAFPWIKSKVSKPVG